MQKPPCRLRELKFKFRNRQHSLDQETTGKESIIIVTQSDMALQGVKERHGGMGGRLNDAGGYSRRRRETRRQSRDGQQTTSQKLQRNLPTRSDTEALLGGMDGQLGKQRKKIHRNKKWKGKPPF